MPFWVRAAEEKGERMTTQYHVGLLKGYGRNKSRVTVQIRSDVDCLDCELWRYVGVTFSPKTWYKSHKAEVLEAINGAYKTAFEKITID